jgi:uncharacterized membrane protein
MQTRKEPSSAGQTWGFGILGGIIVAALDESFSGFAIGAALGIALAQVQFLRMQVRELRMQLNEVRTRTASSREEAETPRRLETPTTAPATPPSRTEAPAPQPATRPPQVARAPITHEPDVFDRALAFVLDWLKRGNPLACVGIVVLFFGAAFLAKYAADNSLFPIELRFIALAAGAFALIGIGWRLREKRRAFAEVLQGGGIAGLYLTVFAAASLFNLLPLGLAFGLMVAIALAAAVLAVAQNMLSLAVIGTAGGFLAPVLISTGSGNHIALFSYYAILNLGICVVAWFRTWRLLNVLGFLFTFTITGIWRAASYTPDEWLSTDAFLILFFLMYVGVSILNCIRQPPNLKGYVSGSLVFGLPVVAFTLHATLVARFEYAMAWSALAVGAFYLILAYALLRSGRDSFRLLIEAFAALGVIFASLAIPLAFDTRTTAAMWAVEGAGLVWLGARQDRKLARAFGALLQVAGGFGYLSGLLFDPDALPLLNTSYLGAAMLALSGLFTGYTLFRNRARQAAYERGTSEGFAIWGAAWWVFAGMSEIERLTDEWLLAWHLIYMAASSVVLMLAGERVGWRMSRRIALYLPAIMSALFVLIAFDAGHPFAVGGWIGWPALFAAFYWIVYRAEREPIAPAAQMAVHAGGAWVLIALLAWEAAWQTDRHAAGVWPVLPWGVVPVMALAWLGRQALLPAWPVARHADTFRVLIAQPIVAVIATWILAANATSVGDPVWIPYLPLINPLDLAVGLCLASGALWWTSLDASQRSRAWPFDVRWLIAAVGALAFFWLNAALIRALHHNAGAPITLYGIARSQLVQAALSIFWAVLGFVAMTLAARKQWRYVWIVGAALMIVVVAKLFLIDLSNVGTIARIVSFLTIGALFVITGYLAPLPPKRPTESGPATETVNP